MRKCPRCNLTFHSKLRFTCLYCDAQLIAADINDFFRGQSSGVLEAKAAKFIDRDDIQGMQYILGNYFKIRSFAFNYSFCRHQIRFGQKFGRFFIEPIRLLSFVKLPWLLINIIDSFYIHTFYQNYCPQCRWKYKLLAGEAVHSEAECNYNKNYSAILKFILNGEIVKEEVKFQDMSTIGPNPYQQLCSRKQGVEWFLDICAILISMGLFISVIVLGGVRLLRDFDPYLWMQ